MFVYSFTRYAGHDRVFVANWDGVSEGDLVIFEHEWYLVLGEDVAWKEQYKYPLRSVSNIPHEVFIPALLSKDTLRLLHRFVYERYTTYKNTIPLFLGDMDELVKRKKRSRKKKNQKSGQELVIFPDMWTLENEVGGKRGNQMKKMKSDEKNEVGGKHEYEGLSFGSLEKGSGDFIFLNGKHTKKQRAEVFWKIKNGTPKTLLCTYSQIFQDWQDLRCITLVDQHKRYYKNQQDPRYYIPRVVKKMEEVYGCEIVKTRWEIRLKN